MSARGRKVVPLRKPKRASVVFTPEPGDDRVFRLQPHVLTMMEQDPAAAFRYLVDRAQGARNTKTGRLVTQKEIRQVVASLFTLHGCPVPKAVTR